MGNVGFYGRIPERVRKGNVIMDEEDDDIEAIDSDLAQPDVINPIEPVLDIFGVFGTYDLPKTFDD